MKTIEEVALIVMDEGISDAVLNNLNADRIEDETLAYHWREAEKHLGVIEKILAPHTL